MCAGLLTVHSVKRAAETIDEVLLSLSASKAQITLTAHDLNTNMGGSDDTATGFSSFSPLAHYKYSPLSPIKDQRSTLEPYGMTSRRAEAVEPGNGSNTYTTRDADATSYGAADCMAVEESCSSHSSLDHLALRRR